MTAASRCARCETSQSIVSTGRSGKCSAATSVACCCAQSRRVVDVSGVSSVVVSALSVSVCWSVISENVNYGKSPRPSQSQSSVSLSSSEGKASSIPSLVVFSTAAMCALAEGVAVGVMRAGTSHYVARHVIQCDDVLVVGGVLVAFISHVDEPGDIGRQIGRPVRGSVPSRQRHGLGWVCAHCRFSYLWICTYTRVGKYSLFIRK